jgi:hypothetical protein
MCDGGPGFGLVGGEELRLLGEGGEHACCVGC